MVYCVAWIKRNFVDSNGVMALCTHIRRLIVVISKEIIAFAATYIAADELVLLLNQSGGDLDN